MKLVCDIFPARVRVIGAGVPVNFEDITVRTVFENSRLVTGTRIVLTSDTVMIAGDSSDGPMLIFRDKYDPATAKIDKSAKTVSWLVTVTGKTLVFDRDSDCGCGSRLRGWNPYRTVYSSNDPTE